jgi:hypothetical protein
MAKKKLKIEDKVKLTKVLLTMNPVLRTYLNYTGEVVSVGQGANEAVLVRFDRRSPSDLSQDNKWWINPDKLSKI